MHEPTKSDPIRAVVADDHPAVLRSVCDVLIDAGVDVVGRASNGEEAAAKIPRTLIEELSLIGPPEKIRDDLAKWRESIVTTLLVSGDAATLRTVAELVLG